MEGDIAVGSPAISRLGRPGCKIARGPTCARAKAPLVAGDAVGVSALVQKKKNAYTVPCTAE